MFNKIYDQIKKFLKENLLSIGILVLVYVACTVEFPYYINAPGSIIPVDKRVTIEGAYESSGSFSMASVSEVKGILPTLLWALLGKNMDIVKKEEKVYNNETYEEANIRSHLLLNESKNNATIVAFQKAGKSYEIINPQLYITYIDELAKTDLKIGDEVLRIEDTEVQDIADIKEIVANLSSGETISFLIKRDGQEMSANATIYTKDNDNYIGISVVTAYEIKTDPEVTFSFKESESGPSGGLMLALAIYNSLVEEDITRGKKIVGTGTISADGTVGAIGGVKYKIAAAIKAKADIFIVPKDNYEEAQQVVKDNHYQIELIEVSTFEETLEKLSNV